jgi:hypothetical protein
MNICVSRERSCAGGSVSSALSSAGCEDDEDEDEDGDEDGGGGADGAEADGDGAGCDADAGGADARDDELDVGEGATRSLVSCSGVGLLSASVPIAKPTARQRSMLSSAAKKAKSLVRHES